MASRQNAYAHSAGLAGSSSLAKGNPWISLIPFLLNAAALSDGLDNHFWASRRACCCIVKVLLTQLPPSLRDE